MAKRIQYMYRLWRARKKRSRQVWKLENRRGLVVRAKQRRVVDFVELFFHSTRVRARFHHQLKMTYEKVWDVENARLFWLNHQTRVSSWERPKLLWRYGDVESPSPWVAITDDADDGDDHHDDERADHQLPDGVKLIDKSAKPSASSSSSCASCSSSSSSSSSKQRKQRHFWHVTAKRSLPRKPDGLTLCSRCDINIALRHCHQCDAAFCFPCHRDTHSHPLGFFQNRVASSKQRADPVFLLMLTNFSHTWKAVEPLVCGFCKSEKLFAAFYCQDCDKQLCRRCFRR